MSDTYISLLLREFSSCCNSVTFRTHIHTHSNARPRTHAHTHKHTYTRMHARMRAHIPLCVCVCVFPVGSPLCSECFKFVSHLTKSVFRSFHVMVVSFQMLLALYGMLMRRFFLLYLPVAQNGSLRIKL